MSSDVFLTTFQFRGKPNLKLQGSKPVESSSAYHIIPEAGGATIIVPFDFMLGGEMINLSERERKTNAN